MKRSLLSVSLRAMILLVTLVAAGLAIGKQVYYERYARHQQGEQYFESLGAIVNARDPCPPEFVFYVHGTRHDGGFQATVTPDFLDRLVGRRLSHPAVRELSFRSSRFYEHHRFNLGIANKLSQLTPYLESIELGNNAKRPLDIDSGVVDATVARLCELKELRVVSFLNWPITDVHVKSLSNLPQLQVLTVFASQLSDESFASLRKMNRLRVLSIQRSGVTPAAAKAFHQDRSDVFVWIDHATYGEKDAIRAFRE